MKVRIKPGSVHGTVSAPPSKSMAIRAIAAATLAGGVSHLENIGDSDDVRAALQCARALGAVVNLKESVGGITEGTIVGTGGNPLERLSPESPLKTILSMCQSPEVRQRPMGSVLDIGESGLCARLFPFLAALSAGPVRVVGHGTVLERPLVMVADGIRKLGARIEPSDGRLPFTVCGPIVNNDILVDGSLTSQHVSGILMALGACQGGVISVYDLVSRRYVDATMEVMKDFGVTVRNENYRRFVIEPGQAYKPCRYAVQGDWSGAAFLLAAGAVSGKVEVGGITEMTNQPDQKILDILQSFGAVTTTSKEFVSVKADNRKPFYFDISGCPDLGPVAVSLAAVAQGVSTVTGAGRLQHKESDRTAALVSEFTKMGCRIEHNDGTLTVRGGELRGTEVDSHNDHRIAMALAVAALGAKGDTVINGAQAVSKSYPGFWDDLERLGVGVDLENS